LAGRSDNLESVDAPSSLGRIVVDESDNQAPATVRSFKLPN
jgi:hypothetical protein